MMPVSFRPGSPGVLNLRRIAKTITDTAATHTPAPLDGAEFALHADASGLCAHADAGLECLTGAAPGKADAQRPAGTAP